MLQLQTKTLTASSNFLQQEKPGEENRSEAAACRRQNLSLATEEAAAKVTMFVCGFVYLCTEVVYVQHYLTAFERSHAF